MSDEYRKTALEVIVLFLVDKWAGVSLLLWDISLGQMIEMNPDVETILYTGLISITPIFTVLLPACFWLGISILIHKLPHLLNQDIYLTSLIPTKEVGSQ